MATLWLVIQRELISNILTSRFTIGFLICLMSTAAAVFVQVEDYEKRLAAYHIAVQEHQETVRTWDLYSQINPKAHRKPNPLSIFNVGMEKSGADMVSIQLATPIWEKEAQKHGSDNPFLSIFLAIDVIFVFKIVLSALAILFAYNTISGEHEDGTLKLVLSNPIPRDTLVIGKYLGGMLSLFPIVIVSFIVGTLIAYASPATDFNSADMFRLVAVLIVSLLYVSTCYLLGMLLSVWTKEATTTLILSMFIWGILTIVHSNIATFAVMKFPPYQPQAEKEILQHIEQRWGDFREERDAYLLKKWGYKYPISAISQISDGPLSISINSNSPGELGFGEFYEIKPIHILDVSKFQEVLGYQEPRRIDYANQAEARLQQREEVEESNRRFAKDISRFSFADAYRFAVGAITDTDRESYRDFIRRARSYKRQVVDYLSGKNAFSARAWFSSDQGAAEFKDLPVFQNPHTSLFQSFSRASSDILILLAWNIVLFMGVYVSFLRYDMS
ncbi:MAG: ABC transporter permease subunit [Candidatus Poribacteria bacterium]|nr:ABC transporter permease subunit [Candidatus Poribacteria bacterium]